MKLALIKKYRSTTSFHSFFDGSLPFWMLGIELPFLVACSTSLKHAAALSIQMFCVLLPTVFISCLFPKKMSPIVKNIFILIAASTVTLLSRQLVLFLFPEVGATLGVYLYLMAFNSLTILPAAQLKSNLPTRKVMGAVTLSALTFTCFMFVLSFVRELIGTGKLWGINVSIPLRLDGLSLSFVGFFLLAFVISITRVFSKVRSTFQISESLRKDLKSSPK